MGKVWAGMGLTLAAVAAAAGIAWGWSGLGGGAEASADPVQTGRTEGVPAGHEAGTSGVALDGERGAAQETQPDRISEGVAIPAPSPAALHSEPQPAASAPAIPLVAYDGPVEHIFFHPLVVYPERAFDGDRMSAGYDDWFVTVPEFKSILSDLYANGYLLVDIRSLYEEVPGDGDGGTENVLRLRKLRLPDGKKPLVLSVDDLNYYTYMRQNGNAYKLVLDEEGRTAAYSVDGAGRERVSREDELVPLVDAFVEEHPDFSFEGAKGVLAVTGYEGLLGYRTDLTDAPGYESEKAAALRVVARLKDTGWSFASHSWGHPDAAKADAARLAQDTARWKREVEPLTGPTPVYIYPYGSRLSHGDPKFRILAEAGFRFFCGVGPSPYLKADGSAVEMDRRHVDGVALRTQGARLAPLFDAKKAFDSRRPKR
ncbi:polysaccharide deacetylase family protein [Gorillibacterium sp. sgz5001074]|uniref:polysaccharide deacetylase family protein n=1 Tax=Gorillibacterium sp. sgz5001074 TaxID=3446695 RepID=UPI003F67FA38